MTLTYPSGALDEAWPDAEDGAEVVLTEADAHTLMAVAGAYHSAQYMLAIRTEQLTRGLWQRMRPVNDASLGQWLGAWDSLMASSAAQQHRLTESYVRTSLRQFGVHQPALAAVEPAEPKLMHDVERWLDSDYADLDHGLHDEAEALLARLRGNSATLADLARGDRLPWLHSPVIRGRAALAGGGDLAEVEPGLGPLVDGALRTNESDVIDNIDWPTFKNGKTMLAKRLPQSGACGWCRIVATRLYSLASMKRSGAWHHGCRCSWGLATEAEVNAYAAGLEEGGYYEAAKRIGLWDGPTQDVNYNDVIGQRAVPEKGAEDE